VDVSWDTPTMAELFLEQGQPDRAAAIYRKLSKNEPENNSLRERLANIEKLLVENTPKSPLEQTLQRFVESLADALSATVLDAQGNILGQFQVGSAHLDASGIIEHYRQSFAHIERAWEDEPQAGQLNELIISTSLLTCILKPLTPHVFLALLLEPKGLSGRARHMLRYYEDYLKEHLAGIE